MAVLIEGIEMPKSCGNCYMFSFLSDSCRITNHVTEEMNDKMFDRRFDDCPLIEVPELHGRLIDTKQLKETLDYYIREAGWSDEINKALSWVKDEFIDAEPTVIPSSEEAE